MCYRILHLLSLGDEVSWRFGEADPCVVEPVLPEAGILPLVGVEVPLVCPSSRQDRYGEMHKDDDSAAMR